MKTIDLYLAILEDVRFNILNTSSKLSDFETDSDGYHLVCKVNDACNILSDLISVMRYEKNK